MDRPHIWSIRAVATRPAADRETSTLVGQLICPEHEAHPQRRPVQETGACHGISGSPPSHREADDRRCSEDERQWHKVLG